MNAVTLASRAVLAQYATKVIRPIEFIVMGLFLILFVGTVLLATYVNAWWWLLMVVVIAYGIIGSIAWLVIHFTIDRLRPEQTPVQKKAVTNFIVRIEKIADTLQITRFGLILRIVRDVMAKNTHSNVLTEFANDSKELKHDFEKVVDTF
jgi:hypothetical protein